MDEFPEFGKITIYGSLEMPLFPVRQVSKFLSIDRIRLDKGEYEITKDYINTKCISQDGKLREQQLLTEIGLYRVVFRGNSPVCKRFQFFATAVLKELRLVGEVTLTKALEKSKLLETEIEKQNQKIAQMENQLEVEHAQMVKYQRDSEKFYHQKMDAQTKLMVVQHRENQMNMWNKGSAEYQLQQMRERFYKKLYVYVEPIPKNLRDEIAPYDDEPHESDDIVLSVSYVQRDRDEISVLYVPPKTTIAAIHEKLNAFSCGNKIYNMSVETLSDELACLE